MTCGSVMATLATLVPATARVSASRRHHVGTRKSSIVSQRQRRRSTCVSVSAGEDDVGDAVKDVIDANEDMVSTSQQTSLESFPEPIRTLVESGVDKSLRFMDERLSIAMKGEAAGGGDEAELLEERRAAAIAEDEAVQMINCLKASSAIRGFGAARLIPRRDYALSELKLNDIEAEKLLAPTESTISGLRDLFSRGLLVLLGGYIFLAHPDGRQIAGLITLLSGFVAVDQIGFGGGMEALALDTAAQAMSPKYVDRLKKHEAAHFLVAYLMGILPKGYTLSSLDAWEKYNALNVQAGCAFCDGDFQREVALGKIGSGSLGKFSCVALAGIGMEYVEFGYAEGGVSDVRQLDGMLSALAFSQKKSDSEVRWAVLNVISILRRHRDVVVALADTMAKGASVGECVQLIEENIGDDI